MVHKRDVAIMRLGETHESFVNVGPFSMVYELVVAQAFLCLLDIICLLISNY